MDTAKQQHGDWRLKISSQWGKSGLLFCKIVISTENVILALSFPYVSVSGEFGDQKFYIWMPKTQENLERQTERYCVKAEWCWISAPLA